MTKDEDAEIQIDHSAISAPTDATESAIGR